MGSGSLCFRIGNLNLWYHVRRIDCLWIVGYIVWSLKVVYIEGTRLGGQETSMRYFVYYQIYSNMDVERIGKVLENFQLLDTKFPEWLEYLFGSNFKLDGWFYFSHMFSDDIYSFVGILWKGFKNMCRVWSGSFGWCWRIHPGTIKWSY